MQAIATTLVAIAGPWFAYKMAMLGHDMKTLEKNTNSIKDELVKVTGEAAFAAGVKDEQDRSK